MPPPPSWAWTCTTCRARTLEPHTGPDDEDLCPSCCTYCTSGQRRADQEQHCKEHSTPINPGEPEPGHGLPTREQMAAAEARGPHHPDHVTDTTDGPLPDDELARQAAEHGYGGSPRATTPDTSYAPPHDLQAEDAVVGATLLSRLAVTAAVDTGLTGTDFYRPGNGRIYEACCRVVATGASPDTTLIAGDLTDRKLLDDIGGHSRLLELTAGAPGTSNAAYYAERVVALARLRRIDHLAHDIRGAVADHNDTRIDALVDELAGRALHHGERPLGHEAVEDFLSGDDPPYDWVIPDLLERGDRVIITGVEGGGKSTLIRQIAVQAAAGIHPFTLEPMEPLTVLLVDLENSRRQVRRKLRPLYAKAAGALDGRLHVTIHSEGLDLTDSIDVRRLENLIDQVRPDLVCGGPVYKLVGGDPTEEVPARAASLTIDRLRVAYGFAFIMESHSPHESNGGKRPIRPYGASLWLRWPEFGFSITDKYELPHFRGQRDERNWPHALQRGGLWPWTIAVTEPGEDLPSEADYDAGIIEHLEAIAPTEQKTRDLHSALMAAHPKWVRDTMRAAVERLAGERRIRQRNGAKGAVLYSAETQPELIDEEF